MKLHTAALTRCDIGCLVQTCWGKTNLIYFSSKKGNPHQRRQCTSKQTTVYNKVPTMKKVLLTKSQKICVTTPEIKLKPQNGVTAPPTICSTGIVRVMPMQTKVITNTYIQRKSHQSIYEDIFKQLMRLPDKDLQKRVIDAINGRSDNSPISSVNQCKQCANNGNSEQKPQKVNASTQTDETKLILDAKEETTIKNETPKKEEIKVSVKVSDSLPKKECATLSQPASPQPTTAPQDSKPSETPAKVPRKRGRKRNTCVPQVVKRSAAQMALQEREDKQLTPLPPVKKKRLEPAVREVPKVFLDFLNRCFIYYRNPAPVLVLLPLQMAPCNDGIQCSPTAPWA